MYFTYGWDLYGVTADGSRVWLIATGAPPDRDFQSQVGGTAASFAVAPDGMHLVYASCRYPPAIVELPRGAVVRRADGTIDNKVRTSGGTFELVRTTRDGESVERLTANLGVDFYPAWSPDGLRIAFVSDDERADADASATRVGLYTMAADGMDIQQVLDEDAAVLHHPPAWSPDGRHLAVVRYVEEKVGFASRITDIGRQLYVVGADGAEPRRLAINVVSGPSWSPDGQRLAIAQAEADGVGLYTIGIDGTGSRRVIGIEGWEAPDWKALYGPADPAAAWIDTVAWSPDSTRILVRSNHTHPALVVNVASGETTEVGSRLRPDGRMWVRAAAWSPDGSRIAMTGGWDFRRGEGSHIVGTVAADGSDAKVLVSRGTGEIPFAVGPQELDLVAGQAACADGTLVPDPAGNAGLVRDCQVLLGLRETFFGEFAPWSNWRPGTPMDQWSGVRTTGTPPRVTALKLVDQGLRGTLSSALGDLTALRTLDLADNFFSGPIPAELGNLSQLRNLRLSRNNLRGPIPPALGRLANLESLELDQNLLTGTIPAELGQLVNLRLLGLKRNGLTGDIPAALGQLPNLEFVALGDNHLTGCVPPELPVDDPASLGLPACDLAA